MSSRDNMRQKKLDLSLYLVLDPDLCGGIDGMVNTTRIAVANGVTAVQLRAEHEFTRRDWYLAALALKQVLKDTTVPLLINDQVDIALAVEADGVHVGQKDLPVDVVRKLIGADKLLGLSISNLQQINQVNWQKVDYLGIGPVFPTVTKQDAAPPLGITTLAELNQCKQCPAVAIGGINLQNAAEVMQSGSDGIAVISAICGQSNIPYATRQLYHVIEQAKQGIKK